MYSSVIAAVRLVCGESIPLHPVPMGNAMLSYLFNPGGDSSNACHFTLYLSVYPFLRVSVRIPSSGLGVFFYPFKTWATGSHAKPGLRQRPKQIIKMLFHIEARAIRIHFGLVGVNIKPPESAHVKRLGCILTKVGVVLLNSIFLSFLTKSKVF